MSELTRLCNTTVYISIPRTDRRQCNMFQGNAHKVFACLNAYRLRRRRGRDRWHTYSSYRMQLIYLKFPRAQHCKASGRTCSALKRQVASRCSKTRSVCVTHTMRFECIARHPSAVVEAERVFESNAFKRFVRIRAKGNAHTRCRSSELVSYMAWASTCCTSNASAVTGIQSKCNSSDVWQGHTQSKRGFPF